MPIDPNIANAMMNPKQFQMPDPMDGMGKALTNALMMEKMRGLSDERAMNNALNEAYRTAGTDRTKLVSALIDKGQGRHAPDVMKKWYEVDETQAKAAKGNADAIETESKAVAKEFENARSLWAGVTTADPAVGTQQALGVVDAQFKNPILSKWYASMNLTPEVMKQGIQQAAQQGQLDAVVRGMGMGMKDALEQHYQLIQEKDKQTLVGVNKYGAPNPQIAGTYGPKPESGTTVNIDNRTADAYSQKRAELAATNDALLEEAAKNGPAQIEAFARARGLVPRAYTGKFANVQSEGNSWLSAGGASMNDDARVASQELKMFLSENSLKNIATMWQEGVKLGAVTKPEFDQLKASVPSLTDDPAVIDAWLVRAQDATRRTMDEYQKRSQQINTNPKIPSATQGIVPPPPQVPRAPVVSPRTGKPIPQDAINDLNRSPGTAALFDKTFGLPPGTALTLINNGGTPNGGNPFP